VHKILAGMVAAGAILLSSGRALADESLVDSVKKACHTELTTVCKGVRQGEGRILACLYAFEDKVSDKCAYAVYDAAMELERAAEAVKYAASQCHDDLQKYCADVKMGKGRGLACLKKNDKSVSQNCKDALRQTGLVK